MNRSCRSQKQILILPSILSADSEKLAEEVADVAGAADGIHIDYMDGFFVPNKTIFAPSLVKRLRRTTGLFFDVHIMAKNPDVLVGAFAEAGADLITVHLEACSDVSRALTKIRGFGKKAGLALRPETPVAEIKDLIISLDLLLIMTVHPGRSGQKFIENSPGKIKEAADLLRDKAPDIMLEVDGGIDLDNIGMAASMGANVFVSGKTIFSSSGRSEIISEMRTRALV